MKYLSLILALFVVACGADCQNEDECVAELKEEWPGARDKAKEDTQAEWDRFDEKWTAEKARREENGEARQGPYYGKGEAQGDYTEYDEPAEVESDGFLRPGLNQEQVLEIYGEPDDWSERLGSGGEIWKYHRDSGLCKNPKKQWCAIYFDEWLRVEHHSNMHIN